MQPEYLNKVLNKALYYNRTSFDSTFFNSGSSPNKKTDLVHYMFNFFLFIDTSLQAICPSS